MNSLTNSTEEQLMKLLSNIYKKANNGATYEDVMKVLTNELSEITKDKRISFDQMNSTGS